MHHQNPNRGGIPHNTKRGMRAQTNVSYNERTGESDGEASTKVICPITEETS